MSRRVIIIGAGVIGLHCAVECLRRGHEVTVLERGGPIRSGCSYGNAGMIVPSHFVPLAAPGMVALGLRWMWNSKSPFYIKPRLNWDLFTWGVGFWRSSTTAHVQRAAPLLRDLHLASRAAYAERTEKGEDSGLVRKGLLMLCKRQQALDEEARYAAHAQKLGIPAEVLSPRGAAALDPAVQMDIAGAVYFPTDCHLQPERLMASLEKTARTLGGTFQYNTPVEGWRIDGGRIRAIVTGLGEIEADEFLLCAGVWSSALARDLRLRIPMQAGKGYSLTLPDPIQLPGICSILTEARVAVTPMNGSLRVGGTMELAGIDETISAARVEGILEALPRYFPQFAAEHFAEVQAWQGLRPCSPDGLPYIGRTNNVKNLVVATAHAMMGISLAPATGSIVGALVDNEPSPFDVHLLNPDRFA